jgi:hypothetical protein
MSPIANWLVRIVWAAFALLLGVGALPHFRDGLIIDQALPVPSYMIAAKNLPNSAYAHAASVLLRADPANGTSRIAGAEAALDSGASGMTQIPNLTAALIATPASTRGWLLLARAAAPTDRKQAAAALSQALILAPYDYWVAGIRVRLAASLWSNLDQDAQSNALRQTRMLWEQQQLRPQLPAILASPGGLRLVRLAFAGQRDDLVALNRWVSAERRKTADAP